MKSVYFDHNASSPLSKEAREAMLPWLEQPANASSRHVYGCAARSVVDDSRQKVAAIVNAHPTQVLFTGGGTEADNLAIQGICANLPVGKMAISAIEHPAVMMPAFAMQRHGWKVDKIGVNLQGQVHMAKVEDSLRQSVSFISMMLVNNETGVVQDVSSTVEMARKYGALVHTDAIQALGKIKLDFGSLGVHAMSISSHKIGGPQGVGALILDKRVDIQPLLFGGGQEKGIRSGSENVAAIAGFGEACSMLPLPGVSTLRDRLEKGLQKLGAIIFGKPAERIGNTSFFAIEGVDGETLVMAMDRAGYAVASGSACSSESNEPSHVLMAMGVKPELAQAAVRVSLGPGNTISQIDGFLNALRNELAIMQGMAALAT